MLPYFDSLTDFAMDGHHGMVDRIVLLSLAQVDSRLPNLTGVNAAQVTT